MNRYEYQKAGLLHLYRDDPTRHSSEEATPVCGMRSFVNVWKSAGWGFGIWGQKSYPGSIPSPESLEIAGRIGESGGTNETAGCRPIGNSPSHPDRRPVCHRIGTFPSVENGFAWHPTLGTAYLPGSSVKGLVRSWATQWEEQVDPEDVKRILVTKIVTASVGSVIFYDAIPLEPIQLEADIMSPHYSPYYQHPGEYPPVDWHAPVPIPFLTRGSGPTLPLFNGTATAGGA